MELDLHYKVRLVGKHWLIPLSCTTENELQFDEVAPNVWLEDSARHWKPPGEFNKNNWILCNLDFNVPGRVVYDNKTWDLIHKFFTDQDKFKQIGVLTRARLVSDLFTLAEAGEVHYEIVLDTMQYLRYEDELLPWSVALKEFDLIRSRLLGNGTRRRLHKIVLCERIKRGNKDEWNSFWKSYYEEESQSSKVDLLQAFACSQKTENLQTLLERSISDPRISREKSIIIFQSLASNKKGYKLMRKFFKKSHSKIISFHSEGEPSQYSYLRILLDVTNRMRDMNKIVQFAIFKNVPIKDELSIKSMDNARRNITWAHENKKELKQFLKNVSFKRLFEKMKNKLKFK